MVLITISFFVENIFYQNPLNYQNLTYSAKLLIPVSKSALRGYI